jgi:NTP pyrophosphatase (non-canonical NTP hydrolase)
MEKTKNLYYIYHIPGKKIGMTRNIYRRVVLQQGYKPGEFQILDCAEDVKYIESREKHWQDIFKYKKDLNSYHDAKNSPINQFKTKKIMHVNVTPQTSTFPVPINKLKGCLMDNLGLTFKTSYGEYTVTPQLVKILVDNARESMYRSTSCYVYNKVLYEATTNATDQKSYSKEPNYDPNNVYDLIRQWATERGIYERGDSKTQYVKLMEESGELARAILKRDKPEIKDAIGDMIVVLTNLAHLEGFNVEDCVTSAYDVIKNRKGQMENGTFVKSTL